MGRLNDAGDAALVGKGIFTAIHSDEPDPLTRPQCISLDPEVVDSDANFSVRVRMHRKQQVQFFDCKLVGDHACWCFL
ncbi:hypothetical protein D3C86_2049450 [compost metagenome]